MSLRGRDQNLTFFLKVFDQMRRVPPIVKSADSAASLKKPFVTMKKWIVLNPWRFIPYLFGGFDSRFGFV